MVPVTHCYLCGQPLGGEPVKDDHVPAKGLFAPELRRRYNLDKFTIRVHAACNALYKRDGAKK